MSNPYELGLATLLFLSISLKHFFQQVFIMLKHFVLNLNPTAKFEWERCSLHHPITAEQPSLGDLVAEAIGAGMGSYLVAVKLEVTVLDQVTSEGLATRSRLGLGLPEGLIAEDRALLAERSDLLIPELAA
ncbi:MAG: hypothetical protein VKJ24_01995 [Synechococcales bacterium]|nr:hypothetical protein [Synechococcales bacterium]